MTETHNTNKKELLLLTAALQALIQQLPDNAAEFPLIESDLIKETLRNIYLKLHLLQQEVPASKEKATGSPSESAAHEVSMHTRHPEKTNIIREITSALTESNRMPDKDSVIKQSAAVEVREAEAGPVSAMATPDMASFENHAASGVDIMSGFQNSTPKTENLSEGKAIENKTIEERIQMLRAAALFEEPATLANKYAASETIGDKMNRSRTEKSLAEKLQQQPLQDLKLSIGINERFSFINKLFGGDQQTYHQCIDQLNNLRLYSDADALLRKNYALRYHWEKDSESYQQFEELIKRRFNA